MATQKDNLAYRYLNLQRRREDGELNYSPTKPPIGLDGVPTAERNNWNVSASDMNIRQNSW